MLRAVVGLLAAAALAGCYRHPNFKSSDVTGAGWGRELALTGHDGKRRSLADFKGKLIVLTFGFTNCPDICPTTLSDVAQVRRGLTAHEANRVQVLFVTLDPERDTRAVLARYVPAFDAAFLGLYGDAEATRRTAREFRISFGTRKGAAPGRYAVDHSAQSYVLDAEGRLRLRVRQDRIAEDLAHDLRELLHQDARHAKGTDQA